MAPEKLSTAPRLLLLHCSRADRLSVCIGTANYADRSNCPGIRSLSTSAPPGDEADIDQSVLPLPFAPLDDIIARSTRGGDRGRSCPQCFFCPPAAAAPSCYPCSWLRRTAALDVAVVAVVACRFYQLFSRAQTSGAPLSVDRPGGTWRDALAR